MGCRKVSSASSDQGNEGINAIHDFSENGDVTPKSVKASEFVSNYSHNKASSSFHTPNLAAAESGSTWSEIDKPGPIAREVFEAKTSVRTKRKTSTLGFKNKRLRIENEDMLELKVTWEQAQRLLRPPPNNAPSIIVVEGCEFEEYEQNAPVIGRPTIPATDHLGKKIQWVQCEDCSKWRKVPVDALLQSKWTCSGNLWDPERSFCSAVQELPVEKLEDLLPATRTPTSKKMKASKRDRDSVEALEGLDALANLAIQEKLRLCPASRAKTKHPRHKPGCSCIVCIQPPSGKGPKHKPYCQCAVCKSMQRRFNTLMLKKEKKHVETDSETSNQILRRDQLPEQGPSARVDAVRLDDEKSANEENGSDEDFLDNFDEKSGSPSLFKGEIDLNIHPEKDDVRSPGPFSSGTLLELLSQRIRQHKLAGAGGRGDIVGDRMTQGGTGGTSFSKSVGVHSSLKIDGSD